MLEFLRLLWVFPFLALGPALVIWLLVERFLPTHWYYRLEFKGKRLYAALWVLIILLRLLLRLLFPGAEPTFFWGALVCCALIVALATFSVSVARIGEVVQQYKERKQQRLELKRQACS